MTSVLNFFSYSCATRNYRICSLPQNIAWARCALIQKATFANPVNCYCALNGARRHRHERTEHVLQRITRTARATQENAHGGQDGFSVRGAVRLFKSASAFKRR